MYCWGGRQHPVSIGQPKSGMDKEDIESGHFWTVNCRIFEELCHWEDSNIAVSHYLRTKQYFVHYNTLPGKDKFKGKVALFLI